MHVKTCGETFGRWGGGHGAPGGGYKPSSQLYWQSRQLDRACSCRARTRDSAQHSTRRSRRLECAQTVPCPCGPADAPRMVGCRAALAWAGAADPATTRRAPRAVAAAPQQPGCGPQRRRAHRISLLLLCRRCSRRGQSARSSHVRTSRSFASRPPSACSWPAATSTASALQPCAPSLPQPTTRLFWSHRA